jgi:hypothetical protein
LAQPLSLPFIIENLKKMTVTATKLTVHMKAAKI